MGLPAGSQVVYEYNKYKEEQEEIAKREAAEQAEFDRLSAIPPLAHAPTPGYAPVDMSKYAPLPGMSGAGGGAISQALRGLGAGPIDFFDMPSQGGYGQVGPGQIDFFADERRAPSSRTPSTRFARELSRGMPSVMPSGEG